MVHTRARSRQMTKKEDTQKNATHGNAHPEQPGQNVSAGNGPNEMSKTDEEAAADKMEIDTPNMRRPVSTPGDNAPGMTEREENSQRGETNVPCNTQHLGINVHEGPSSNVTSPICPNVPDAAASAQTKAKKEPSASPEKKIKWRGAPNDDDLTAYHPDQAHWSLRNLPDIIYVLRPTAEHYKSRAKIPKTTYEIFGKIVNDFPMLPLQISSKVEGWRAEAWSRMDRRITPEDIIDRVNPKYQVTTADIQMRRYRFRQGFRLGAWGSGSSISAVARLLEKAGISPELNSTRGLTPGLIRPELGEAGGRVPIPESWFNIDSVTPRPGAQRLLPANAITPRAAPAQLALPPSRKKEETDIIIKNKAEIKDKIVFNFKSSLSPLQAVIEEYPSPVQEVYEPFLPYPDPEDCELAYHDGPPSRVFRKEKEEKHVTMTLEEYLQRNNLSYAQYLEREDESRPRKRRALLLPLAKDEDMENFMSFSKRLRRSIEAPPKSSDSEMDETASDILVRFKAVTRMVSMLE